MNTFNKEERLCSRKLIDLLFKDGSSFLLYPFRVSYLLADTPFKFPAQVVINVSKKRYKHAVDRNLVKRRCREAYRLQKQTQLYPFLSGQEKLLLLSVQFVGKKIYEYSFFEKKLAVVFTKLVSALDTGPKEVEAGNGVG
jgi:ribonuclease P protein component